MLIPWYQHLQTVGCLCCCNRTALLLIAFPGLSSKPPTLSHSAEPPSLRHSLCRLHIFNTSTTRMTLTLPLPAGDTTLAASGAQRLRADGEETLARFHINDTGLFSITQSLQLTTVSFPSKTKVSGSANRNHRFSHQNSKWP